MAKEKTTDSVNHMESRRAKMKAEIAELEKQEAEEEARRTERQEVRDMKADDDQAVALQKQAELIPEGETRDQLLERVRRMREEPPANTMPAPLGKSAWALEQQAIEEQAGREAVARAEKQMEVSRQIREAAAAETRAREGYMTPVHQPNPGQNEQFPASGATLKGK